MISEQATEGRGEKRERQRERGGAALLGNMTKTPLSSGKPWVEQMEDHASYAIQHQPSRKYDFYVTPLHVRIKKKKKRKSNLMNIL